MRSRLQILDSTDNSGQELVSLCALKLELGITDSDEDNLLEDRITRASRLIAEYCGRSFALSYAVETFTFDQWEVPPLGYCPFEGRPLLLSLYPVQQIDSVTVDGEALAEGDYDVDEASGRLWRRGGWWGGVVQVTYFGGYDLPDGAPASLASAVIEAVSDRRDAESGEAGVREVSHGDTRVSYYQSGTTTTTGGLSNSVLSLIAPFKRLAMA